MGIPKLDIGTLEAVGEYLKANNLIVVPKDAYKQQQEANSLLKQKSLTPYMIIKHGLLPGVSNLKTIKNMVLDGRIGVNENYKDENGKWFIMTSAIKRLRDEH